MQLTEFIHSKGFSIIAGEVGISHGTIFAHFLSLDELLGCLIQDLDNVLGLEIHHSAESKDSVEELLITHLMKKRQLL